mgnify:CR=1 FL=1
MVVDNITEGAFAEDHSQASSSSQVTDDPALKDSQSGKSTTDGTSVSSGDESSKFVKKESRQVFYLRVTVLLILFSASAAISLVVFFVTDAGEMESFESQYYAAADKVTENFHTITTERLQAVGSLIVAMIAHGKDHTRTWPFVTLSSFQQRASTVKDLSGCSTWALTRWYVSCCAMCASMVHPTAKEEGIDWSSRQTIDQSMSLFGGSLLTCFLDITITGFPSRQIGLGKLYQQRSR